MYQLNKYGVIAIIADTYIVQTIYSEENERAVKKYLKKHRIPNETEPYDYKNKKGLKVRYVATFKQMKQLKAISLRANINKLQAELDSINNLK